MSGAFDDVISREPRMKCLYLAHYFAHFMHAFAGLWRHKSTVLYVPSSYRKKNKIIL